MPVAFPTWRREAPRPATLLENLARLLSGLALALAVLTGVVVVGLVSRRFHHFVRESSFFTLERVEIAGASARLDREIREQIERMRAEGAENLLEFNLSHARFYLEALPRVRSVEIRKEYPRTLRVEVQERVPVTSLSANGGRLFLVDEDGVVFARAEGAELASLGAPPVTGIEGELELGSRIDRPRLLQILQTLRFLEERDPELANRFAEWHLTPDDEVTGILAEGVEVRFGDADLRSRLPALAAVLDSRGGVEPLTYLDLRFESQVVYR